MTKILSIIVPSYNMENYLPKCLGSLIVDDPALLQQLDVIVVNDGSKDRTSEIAHEFESKYPGVFRVIDKSNGHYGSCINAALQIVTGLYVKILDADDTFNTSAFQSYLGALSADVLSGNSPDLLISDFVIVEDALRALRGYAYIAHPGFRISQFFQGGKELWMHAIAYRTALLRELDYHQMEGITHTDVQWIHTPMSVVKMFKYYGYPVYEYKDDRDGNTSNPIGFLKTFKDLVKVTRQLLEECPQTERLATEDGKRYLFKHLLYRASRVYFVHIVHAGPLLDPNELREFDSFLAEANPEIYMLLDSERLGGRLRVQYIRTWRKHRRMTAWLRLNVALQKIYGRLRSMR